MKAPRKTKNSSLSPITSLLTEQDLYLFNEGSHLRLYQHLGAHPLGGSAQGTYFAVWAPNAASVAVMGDFNGWDRESHPLQMKGNSGIWEGVLPEAVVGQRYKYFIRSNVGGYSVEKADPFGFLHEVSPLTASVIADLNYPWSDENWMTHREHQASHQTPVSIYEVHLGSWRRVPEEGGRSLTYRELAEQLPGYLKGLGFTHVEVLPVMEHPFYGSWGYQTTGYFAPASRLGSPQDFMYLVDRFHQEGIGVILDWVPSHFPADAHGLAFFDGTHLFEHADPRQGYHPDWGSSIFNYGRHEVRSFLLSSGMFWLDAYHIDGLRVDAVASMLYLDYSRKEGEWIPNRYGGRENLEAIDFLRRFNQEAYAHYPGIQTFAEESTAWPMVSRPLYVGGLGFGYKWDMGWMHDTLRYFSKDPVHRKFHHNDLTFRMLYAFSENFTLPLSHDEVVHGKGSLIGKMPGDEWQKRANLRLLLAWMYGQTGKKLLFMGAEFGQWREWDHEGSLDWHLLDDPRHRGLHLLLGDLNRLYRQVPALHAWDCHEGGFEWVDCNDNLASVLSFLRQGPDREHPVLAVFNFTPVLRDFYRVGVPFGGRWRVVLNTDAGDYGGSGAGPGVVLEAVEEPCHGRPWCLKMLMPPLAAMFFVRE